MEAHYGVKGREDPVFGEFLDGSLPLEGPSSTSVESEQAMDLASQQFDRHLAPHNL